MQALRGRLLSWSSWIQRACRAYSVTVTPVTQEGFSVRVQWEKPVAGEYEHPLTPADIFGDTLALVPQARRACKCAGDFSRDVVRGVLGKRGIL